jgi:hypothetical protein
MTYKYLLYSLFRGFQEIYVTDQAREKRKGSHTRQIWRKLRCTWLILIFNSQEDIVQEVVEVVEDDNNDNNGNDGNDYQTNGGSNGVDEEEGGVDEEEGGVDDEESR